MFTRMNNDVNMSEVDHEPIEFFPEIRCELTTHRLKEYIKGGRGIITLENTKSGVHKTYEFRRPNNPEDFRDDVLFVYVLTSDSNWLYVGMYTWRNSYFKLTRNSKFGYQNPIVKGAIYLAKIIRNNKQEINPMRVFHEGICSVCGRKLTTPKSIECGIGPKCRKAMQVGYALED